MKTCTKCGEGKPLTEFYRRRNRPTGSGYDSRCKDCAKALTREWNARNALRTDINIPATQVCSWCKQELPGTAFALNRSKAKGIQSICYACHRARRYGLAVGQYEQMLTEQGSVCLICRRPCPRGGELSVDHDHATGRVRGLLCQNCNSGLGMFQDDPALLGAAIDYLKRAADCG